VSVCVGRCTHECDIKGISSTSVKVSVQMYLPLSLKIFALSNISALVLLDFCGEDTYFGWAGLNLAHLGSAQLDSALLDSTRLGSAQLGSAWLGSTPLSSAQLGSALFSSTWLG
jgi:hypothetical protein